MSERLFCFSIDVDWVPGSEGALLRLYELAERYRLRPTVFFVGRFAQDYPETTREAVRRGYEIGTHGWVHGQEEGIRGEDFRTSPYERQKEWLGLATDAVAKAAGVQPLAFRAPNLSVGETTLRVLEELGYKYDSSVPAGRFDFFYGQVSHPRHFRAPRDPYHPSRANIARRGDSPILEIPPSAYFLPMNTSSLRVLGMPRVRWAARRIAKRARTLVFYVHPAEFEVAEKQTIPGYNPARHREGLGPQNLELIANLVEYVLGLGYKPATLAEIAAANGASAAQRSA